MASYVGRTSKPVQLWLIIRELKRRGFRVQPLMQVGEGCPHLAVLREGKTFWLRLHGRMSEADATWNAAAAAHRIPVFAVDSIEAALEVLSP